MKARTDRLIDYLKKTYRDDPDGFRALLPGPTDATHGPPYPTNARNQASTLSDDELAYHRSRLASALRTLRGK